MEFIPRDKIIHAVQWFPGSDPSIIECTRAGETFGLLDGASFYSERSTNRTVNSQQVIEPGDYIQTCENGRRYIYTRETFEKEYVARSRFNPNVRVTIPAWSIDSPE